jgi:hypothetical protein
LVIKTEGILGVKCHFSNDAATANPKLGDEFLEEVSQTTLFDHWNPCDGSWPFD